MLIEWTELDETVALKSWVSIELETFPVAPSDGDFCATHVFCAALDGKGDGRDGAVTRDDGTAGAAGLGLQGPDDRC